MYYRMPYPLYPRWPIDCPAGFGNKYTVVYGDTFRSIARKFEVNLNELIAANRHIPNPNILIPGDIICVPVRVKVPCTFLLKRKVTDSPYTIPDWVSASALISRDERGNLVITISATLPQPEAIDPKFKYYYVNILRGLSGTGIPMSTLPHRQNVWAASHIFYEGETTSPRTEIFISANVMQGSPPPGDLTIFQDYVISCFL